MALITVLYTSSSSFYFVFVREVGVNFVQIMGEVIALESLGSEVRWGYLWEEGGELMQRIWV